MNFDFSEDVTMMRDEVRRVLADQFPAGAVRQAVDAGKAYDSQFWSLLVEMGWAGIAIPERFGGSGLGYEPLCMIAEEMGAALGTTPFASSIYLAAEALSLFADDDLKSAWLPRLAAGEVIGCFALAEGPGDPTASHIGARVENSRITGVKWPVVDGDIADIAIVVASEDGEPGLWLVELADETLRREPLKTIDAVRTSIRLTLDGAPATRLAGVAGWPAIERLLDRAAVLVAFEQVGGAQRALDTAVAFAKERYAFGRPIASFQAIKHKLADMYVAIQLARSNAYYGAWALEHDAPELAEAAASARLAATDAFTLAAKENIQTHGGMGFTWEADCHLYYRRARELAVGLGSTRYWRDRLIDTLAKKEVA